MNDHCAGNSNCLIQLHYLFKEKLRLQQEWIENLIEQNEMLVRAVGELEVEATERVHMLEEKLQKSAQCICEVKYTIIMCYYIPPKFIVWELIFELI